MLVRKAVNWQSERSNVYVGNSEKLQQKEKFLLDVSPEMIQVAQILGILAVCVITIMFTRAIIFSNGHELVGMQQKIVALTKANDQLDLDVAELKSPIRIQEIAQKKLGMVLPDSFVYSSKSATTERSSKSTRPIVD